ncbi:FecCD family ABC transporter permease [Actinophytocola gossypii]|uniref:Iron chelate uptake ABC transporter family permease subunit n=1 Tax=Actinophytocola gossypii TaxID=2812003 RepID=A0ABT2JEW7_9PSEU|nr:iron chelate uptake ABC transporter family permease subunit [Actinophytocola gossypii]MCT2586400.1 iron chelate uptake ABC transporter family permease subunit [Actinophytocola gossypii]
MAALTTVRLTTPPVSWVVRPRLLAVSVALCCAGFLLFCLGMTVGDYPLSLGQVLAALVSEGSYYDQVVVYDWRMPRALVGLLVGIAFGMAGALFQTITRNPLASPDVIGISAGATTAVVAGIVLGFGAGIGTQTLGLAGGVGAALTIYLLAWRRGTTGYRIVLVGVGVAWMCTSATGYLLARAKLHEAQAVVGWMVGNLNDATWGRVVPLLVSMAVLVPIAVVLGGWLRTLSLGDDVAVGLGTPVQQARLVLLLSGVGLVAFGTAAAGPVAFVALSAPQIAKRLAGWPVPPLVTSGFAGAVIVLGGDLVARSILPGTQLPVGVVTGALGAPFLLWLLTRANRAGSGG